MSYCEAKPLQIKFSGQVNVEILFFLKQRSRGKDKRWGTENKEQST